VGTSFGKKPSYFALQSLIKDLNGFTFVADRSISGVTILEFKKGLNKKYFYWSPTSNDTKAIFKIGNKSLLATEYPQTYVPANIVVNTNIEDKAVIQVEKD
jgi:hypothetical protein